MRCKGMKKNYIVNKKIRFNQLFYLYHIYILKRCTFASRNNIINIKNIEL